MPDNHESMTLTFRCPAGLEDVLPPPVPAAHGLPDWLKAMPPQAFSAINGREENTVKRCPPFIDAMTSGFLIPLMCDLKVENGEFTWDNDIPPGGAVSFVRSPIGYHDASQVTGTPLFETDRFLIKFHNLWTIEAPDGYAVLFTHPFNRFDLPFTTLTGMVDCDRYHDNWVHFPAHWHDPAFSGVLPKARRSRNACRSKGKTGWRAPRRSLMWIPSGRTTSQPRSTVSPASIGGSFGPDQVSSFHRAGISQPRSAAGRSGHAMRRQAT